MAKNAGSLLANLVCIADRRIVRAAVNWSDGVIRSIDELGPERAGLDYLIPGFIDAHVHLESSLLPPSEFARLAVRHGTVGCICDPHEIANVLGVAGVQFMLRNARETPFHFLFGAPSCVPVTSHEEAGATLDSAAVERLLSERGIGFLGEVMDVAAVTAREPSIMAKIDAARRNGLPVDGHAPELRGAALQAYAAAGITTDHEAGDLDEAREKIESGMRVQIREGSASRNLETLLPLIVEYTDRVMFCTDDLQPNDLQRGHIDRLAARAIERGFDRFDVLRCACLTPAKHYRLPVGQLRVGDPMDAVAVADLRTMSVRRTWLSGFAVFDDGECALPRRPTTTPNRFHAERVAPDQISPSALTASVRVIEVEDGSLRTRGGITAAPLRHGRLVADPERDLGLLCVINRYRPQPPVVGIVRGFGLHAGALASSIAHDSHNLIAVGTDPTVICAAINALIDSRGGLAVAGPDGISVLDLPIAGLMSTADADSVAKRFAELCAMARKLGCPLRAPFTSLSFLALPVIPELRLGARGLWDAIRNRSTDLFVHG